MRPFGVEDLGRQVAIGQLALDPAGELVVYTRRTVVDGRDRIDLWAVPTAGGAPRALTEGPSRDTQPRFSFDGTRIAYLSADGDDPAQLHLLARDGGPPRPIATFPSGVDDFAWTPDDALVVLAADAHPRIPPAT